MAFDYRIGIILFLGLYLSLSLNTKQKISCNCKNQLNYCALEKYEKGKLYFIISISNCTSGKVLDTLIKYNFLYYQYYAKDDIKLVINADTLLPESYIFEDNMNGSLPYYKQIVGYNIPKEYRKLNKKLLIKNNNLINEINIDKP